MPLTDTEIRDRRFMYGGATRLLSFLKDSFSSLLDKLQDISDVINATSKKIKRVEVINDVTLKNEALFKKMISAVEDRVSEVTTAINKLDKKDPVSITTKEIDINPITKNLATIEKAVSSIQIPKVTEKDIGIGKIIDALEEIQKQIENIPMPDLIVPPQKDITFPKEFSIREAGDILNGLKEVSRAISTIPQSKSVDLTPLIDKLNEISTRIAALPPPPTIEFPTAISIDNFPPQKIPQPVTNININPLRGFVKTTAQTVGTGLAVLPGYGVLDNRRSVLIYNNDSAATLYIGGSDVTTSNGMPVPPKSFSPIIDAGVRMIVYGVSTTNINVRVMEASNEAIGG